MCKEVRKENDESMYAAQNILAVCVMVHRVENQS